VTYSAQPDDPALPVFRLMASNLVLQFALFLTEPWEALLRSAAEITTALREGVLTPLPVSSFGLDDVAAAHEAVENGIVGKAELDLRSVR
jgi:NADPH2:quinone reductase